MSRQKWHNRKCEVSLFEAIRQTLSKTGKLAFIHVTLVPYLKGSMNTIKPTAFGQGTESMVPPIS